MGLKIKEMKFYFGKSKFLLLSLPSTGAPEGDCRRGYTAAAQMNSAPPQSAGSVTSHFHTDTCVHE